MGGKGDEIGKSIIIDINGNSISTGFYYDTTDFDPGLGVFNQISKGGPDIFITKLNSQGNLIWAKSFGGSQNDYWTSIASDINANVYITGSFQGTCDFDPGPAIFNLTSLGLNDIFITKLDSAGNFVWAKQFSGSLQDEAFSLTLDVMGNIYITGYFHGVDFDPGISSYNLTSNGNSDIFIAKLNNLGNFIWAKSMGGTFTDMATKIKLDANANVYTIGNFGGTVDFNPSSGIFNITSSGDTDIFISKLDSAGNFIWTKSFGGNLTDIGNALFIDGNGNIYATGLFYGNVDFDPGLGTYNLNSSGGADIFISKLNNLGNFLWAKKIGGLDSEGGIDIHVDSVGNIFTCGYFSATVDFDPDTAIFNQNSNGSQDIFISKFDSLGNFGGVLCMGRYNNELANGITLDGNGNLYCIGYYSDSVDFDPGQASSFLASVGNDDIFILKFKTCAFFNKSISKNGNTLIANESGAMYQWLKCNPFGIIGGATNQSYIPISSGSYAVKLTKNGCTDTSSCFTYIASSLNDINQNLTLQISPNPFSNNVSILSPINLNDGILLIYNLFGEIIYKQEKLFGIQFNLEFPFLVSGIYILELKTENKIFRTKISKE